MHLLFLPGYSPRNRTEMNDICDYFGEQGYITKRIEWAHWTDDTIVWDPEAEAKRIAEILENSTEHKDMIIIAKSLGTYVAMLLMGMIDRSLVKKLILMGIPYNDMEENERSLYPQVLNELGKTKLYIIQNELDTHGSWIEAKRLISGATYKSLLKSGISEHSYNYPADIFDLIQT